MLRHSMAFHMGAFPATEGEASETLQERKDAMRLAYKNEPPAMPPIDAEAPVAFETASFGLG